MSVCIAVRCVYYYGSVRKKRPSQAVFVLLLEDRGFRSQLDGGVEIRLSRRLFEECDTETCEHCLLKPVARMQDDGDVADLSNFSNGIDPFLAGPHAVVGDDEVELAGFRHFFQQPFGRVHHNEEVFRVSKPPLNDVGDLRIVLSKQYKQFCSPK